MIILLALIAVCLCLYLVYALVNPEKF
ncbi:K(+)-transporting ATPase subunit F [Anaerorhabdus sp.]